MKIRGKVCMDLCISKFCCTFALELAKGHL